MRWWIVLLGIATGCVHEIRATPAELEAARVLLRDGKPAPVHTTEGVVQVSPGQTVELVTGDVRLAMPVADVVKDCPDHAAEDGRLCEFHGVSHVVLDKRRDAKPVLWSIFGSAVVLAALGTFGGTVYCAAECDGTAQSASQVALGAAGLWLLYIVATHGFG